MNECVFDENNVCVKCGLAVRGKPGRRPCRAKTAKRGFRLGDAVEKSLSFFGITKKRVERITGKPCGCAARQEALNTWGDRVLAAFRKQ